MLRRSVTSSRFFVYLCCTALALVAAYCLGKDMQWDTLDYHLYAGFSAIHNRFDLDYFPAAAQSYLNPYAYVPFYLLVTSGLDALTVAGILAVLQSAILWMTYELAAALAPPDRPRVRVGIGAAAALLAFANPVLIQQLGSSFADITTGELALAGWLVAIVTVRKPSVWRIVGAGLLLGAASALKLSNALGALAVAIVPLFIPVGWSKRLASAGAYALSVGLTFVLVSAPWSIQLQRYFGNPLFPLLNTTFRSPQYTTAPVIDFRFIPPSLGAALWRPFAMIAPLRMVHVETRAPDLRYAILLALAALWVIAWIWRRSRTGWLPAAEQRRSLERRMLLALGCAFLIDWAIWIAISGNSRYFIPVACVAAALIVGLSFRLLAAWPRLCACVMVAMIGAQIYQVQAGSVFRPPLPWGRTGWFDVSLPQALARQPALFFSIGIQSNAFIAPYLAAGSGFVNLEGDYVLGPGGANGARIQALIRRFSPHLRLLVSDTRVGADHKTDIPQLADLNDAVEPFGLRVDSSRCVRIVARDTPTVEVLTVARQLPPLPPSEWYTRYLVSCQLVPDRVRQDALKFKERAPNLALDRLEDACPSVLRPRRPVTFLLNGKDNQSEWVRRYGDTDVEAWVSEGRIRFQAVYGGDQMHDLGSVSAWEKKPPPIICRRTGSGLFLVRLAQ